jgi:hypothetical protein
MKVAMKVTENIGRTESTTIRELGNPASSIPPQDYLSAEFASVLRLRLEQSWPGRTIKKVVINVILED